MEYQDLRLFISNINASCLDMYGQDVCFDTEHLSFLEKIGFPKRGLQ